MFNTYSPFKGSLSPLSLFKSLKFKYKFRKEHPGYFDPEGILIFSGSQGEGKTISAVSYVIELSHLYPGSILITNVDIDPSVFPDGYVVHEYSGLDDLKNYENGYSGVIYLIDEIHLELNSLESTNIDIDTMTELSQQRKQRKHIVGTSQRYNRMAKPLREQVRNLVVCNCFFGLFQFNRYVDMFRSTEKNGEVYLHVKKRFFWFHNPDLYSCYDTYAKMKRYKKEWKGYKRISRSDFYG